MRSSEGHFDRWADDFAADWVRANPQLATSAQYFVGDEADALDRQLTLANPFGAPYGKRAAALQAKLARRGLAELRAFPTAQLTREQRTSAAILEWRLQDAIANERFAAHRFVFSQMTGLHVSLVSYLATRHPLRNERDAENYLTRLALVAGALDEGIAEARDAAAHGFIPPRFIIERTIEQLDDLIAAPPAAHVLVTTFADRLARAGISSASAREGIVRAQNIIGTDIVPAFGRVRAMLGEQLAQATDAAGAWALPDGKEYYARQLASFTGTTLSAADIHAIGLREVTRIEAEMDAIFAQLGYREGSIADRTLRLDESLRLAHDPDPREDIVAQLAAVVRDAEARSQSMFDLKPSAPVVVKREPAFSEKSAAAHYTPPAPDGTQPGIYWIPLADLSPNVPWLGVRLKSTAYHEAIPGHHFQLAIQQEMRTLPRFRKLGAFGYDASFAEGWALYSETLCDENGWYEGDLPARLGYLQLQLFRARRLVVDTGLHDLRWTREQAIDYGFTAAEIERYIAWPGQATSYMIGALRIMELRERARAVLGERFSIQAFHNLVLGGATMPLEVLAREVTAWTQETSAGSAG